VAVIEQHRRSAYNDARAGGAMMNEPIQIMTAPQSESIPRPVEVVPPRSTTRIGVRSSRDARRDDWRRHTAWRGGMISCHMGETE
jgi:hypothetical protein